MRLNDMKRKIELTPKELERKAMIRISRQISNLKSKLYDMSNEYDDYEGTNVSEFIRYLIDEEIEDIYTI